MRTGTGYYQGYQAAQSGRPRPTTNNWMVNQNISAGYNAGSKK
ncbi:MAG: hypothetical protein AAGH41_02700 [Pseudomonadota bacterium]